MNVAVKLLNNIIKSDHKAAEGPTQTADVQRKTELSGRMTQTPKSLTKSTDMKEDVGW